MPLLRRERQEDVLTAGSIWVAPDSAAEISGGHRYNLELTSALLRLGVRVATMTASEALTTIAEGHGDYWVDSLYLDRFGELLANKGPATRVGLVVHYLPSLVRVGDGLGPQDLGASELLALRGAEMFLVPSRFMARALRSLGVEGRPVLVVEPGWPAVNSATPAPASAGVHAIVIGALIPSKGLLELLIGLGRSITPGDRLQLHVVGSETAAPEYAADCRRVVAGSALLQRAVVFCGARPHQETLARLAVSNLLISVSIMESFGMALAEARAAGVPILARPGGNVAVHISEVHGGTLVANAAEVASELLAICRHPARHQLRIERAASGRIAERSWEEAARSFMRQRTESQQPRG